MMKKSLAVLVLTVSALSINAQTSSDVLLTVEDEKITVDEFMYVYNKNQNLTETVEKKSMEEYLDLFINFKLKVHEAKELNMHKNPNFNKELREYRAKLAKPYLTDKEVTEKLVKESYERLKYDVDASHILIRLHPNALPKDTLVVYDKMLGIREKIMSGEATFEEMVMLHSEDSGKKTDKGRLGYFTAFKMLYNFETAAYNTPIGEVSKPVRTYYGYHLVKVNDKRPALGRLVASHIFIKASKNADEATQNRAKNRIDEIYGLLEKGNSFESLAKQYSEDENTAPKGGDLGNFGINEFIPEFENAAYSVEKEGEYTKPFKTPLGWHIIKVTKKISLLPYEKMKDELYVKVELDDRSNIGKKSIANRLKREYRVEEFLSERDDFYEKVDLSFFEAKWYKSVTKDLNETIFTINEKQYNQQGFAEYLYQHQITDQSVKKEVVPTVNGLYDAYLESSLLNYENSKLEEKYPEFKALMNEYRDGILLFELNDKMVWSKSIIDTTGLREFYNAHKDDYKWDTRYDVRIYSCNSKKMAKKALKMAERGDDPLFIQTELNKDSELAVRVEEGKYEEDDNELIEKAKKSKKFSKVMKTDRGYQFVEIIDTEEPRIKELPEARGQVMADYQKELEKKWIEELKAKYSYSINKEVLESIKK